MRTPRERVFFGVGENGVYLVCLVGICVYAVIMYSSHPQLYIHNTFLKNDSIPFINLPFPTALTRVLTPQSILELTAKQIKAPPPYMQQFPTCYLLTFLKADQELVFLSHLCQKQLAQKFQQTPIKPAKTHRSKNNFHKIENRSPCNPLHKILVLRPRPKSPTSPSSRMTSLAASTVESESVSK